jgi:hypothetical protein
MKKVALALWCGSALLLEYVIYERKNNCHIDADCRGCLRVCHVRKCVDARVGARVECSSHCLASVTQYEHQYYSRAVVDPICTNSSLGTAVAYATAAREPFIGAPRTGGVRATCHAERWALCD